MIVTSVRARLALWHTTVLAVLLAAFAVAAYLFVSRAVSARTDASLADALLDFRTGLLAERGPGVRTPAVAREVLGDVRSRTIAFTVFDSAGRVVAAALPPPPPPPARENSESPFDPRQVETVVRSTRSTTPIALTVPDAEGGYRVQLELLAMPDGRFTIAAATSLHDNAELLGDARAAMVLAIPAGLVLAWVGGWLLARRSLAPMVAIRDVTARISASTLRERVPIANQQDEVGQLAAVINELLERLERAFAQQRQFMADASHELRTPVAVVQNEASRALARPERSAAEYEDAMRVVLAAGRRLRRIVDDLFLLARADAGELPVRRDPLYLDEIVAECAREIRSLAEVRGVRIGAGASGESPYTGDEALLHRLLINLLDNAIKHTPAGGSVAVRLVREPAGYRVEVENPGPRIPPELASRIFDRFVRGDIARSHEATDALSSGAGLGLPIARWIAAAHGGRLELARSDELGTVFAVHLPISSRGSPRC